MVDCIKERPPTHEGIFFDACDGYEACLTVENAKKLVRYLNQVQIYMNDWYAACGAPLQTKD